MSAMSRFGSSVAKTLVIQQQRQMAVASSTHLDPIQKLFLDKVKEFKSSSKGLDEKHQKAMSEEMKRLQRVYRVEDENKLAHVDAKFSSEVDVSLHDLDTSKEFREKVYSGEYRRQLAVDQKPKSALIESIPYREPDSFHLPLINKPIKKPFYDLGPLKFPPPKVSGVRDDIDIIADKVTPESLQRDLRVVFGEKMVTIDDDKSPQRDTVNYPRQGPLMDCPPTVGHIIPYSWFKFFYQKTGVTGPYAFGVGFTTFLLSKEWLVMEHELISGLSLILLFSYVIPKFGPALSSWAKKDIDHDIKVWDEWQKGSIDALRKIKNSFTDELNKGPMIDDLYEARRQDVNMQTELEYRRRLKAVFEDTKRRLNYLVAVADSKRQIHQNYLVNWVISNVHSAIGPKQEEEYLNNCIVNLKQLAQKNANAI